MAVFSTHPVKTIATGEGGVTTTSNQEIAEQVRSLRNHAMIRDPAKFVGALAFDQAGEANPWYYELQRPSLNYRATDFQCALGTSQLRKLHGFVVRRQELARRYCEALEEEFGGSVTPNSETADSTPALHIFSVRIDFRAVGVTRAVLMNRLRERGIGTQVHYIPLHRQPYYEKISKTSLPGADAYYESTMTLPLFPAMEIDDVDHVVCNLAAALAG